jgi:hypothetical protein
MDTLSSELTAVFASGMEITKTVKYPKLDGNGVVILGAWEEKKVVLGRGLLETQLKDLGYEKRELKKFAHMGMLKKVTVRVQGGWRNTYVLVDELIKRINQE